jgi:predicted transcriptional regulator
VRTIHKDATFTTGKAAKERKRKKLLKEILSARSSNNGLSPPAEISNTEGSILQFSMGLDVLKRLESQGKIVTDRENSALSGVVPERTSNSRPQASRREKSLIRRHGQSRDQIFTVTNSRGDLVEALVTLESVDEALS